jgi:cytochrome c peroxidase
MRWFACLWCCLLTLASPALAEVAFTDEERAFILSHGPWPPTFRGDPSNRFSGDTRAIAFGKALFSDRRLSGAEDFSCADCQQPANHFADGLPLTMGQNRLDRNTPTLANLSGLRWYGWSGGNDNLWAQSLRPMLDPREMNASPAVIAARVRAAADLAGAYKVMTGHPSGDDDDETVAVTLAKALAAYQEILVTPRTAFDRYRDGLDSGDAQAIEAYPEAAKRGLNIFAGEGRCSLCHFGPAFSNGEFHDVGRRFFIDGGRVDPGRYTGIKAIRQSPYTRAGRFSDEPEASAHQAPSQFVGLNHRNWGEWRVPSLRNVANTAPYMHDGSLAKLEDVVRHYSEIDMERLHTNGESLLRPLRLTEGEITDLVAFLNTLSGGP